MTTSKFKKIFGDGTLPQDEELNELAKFMAQKDPPSSTIPAGYTYLAQFVDHDIALDSLGHKLPWEINDLSGLENLQKPVFDLETLYGKDAEETSAYLVKDSPRLKLGLTSDDPSSVIIKIPIEQDLPRNNEGSAEISGKRNDENLLVAQTHVAFIKFHNTIAAQIGGADITKAYKTARRQTIRHYQYIIFRDLLPKIVDDDVLTDILQKGGKFYQPAKDDLFIPLEFSAAAYRMGHSMVRNTYQLNARQNPDLFKLSAFTGNGSEIKSMKKLPGDWLINWHLFFNLTGWTQPPEKFNFALKINTRIASGLGKFLPVIDFDRKASIPALDLYRGRLFKLPTGQMTAKALGVKSLEPEKIAALLPPNLSEEFKVNTPLWFYILAEAEAEAEENEEFKTLGKVGSRLVAEVFVELLKQSPYSILDKVAPAVLNFPSPEEEFFGSADKKFGMAEMLNFIESKNKGFLNPLGI